MFSVVSDPSIKTPFDVYLSDHEESLKKRPSNNRCCTVDYEGHVAGKVHSIFSSPSDVERVSSIKPIKVQPLKPQPAIVVTDLDNCLKGVFEISSVDPTLNHDRSIVKVLSEADKEAIKKKHGNCWECMSREKGTIGFVYTFRFKSEEHNQFPSIEKPPKILRKEINEHMDKEILNFLGYSYHSDLENVKTHYFTAPDLEELFYRWNELRANPEHAKMPELKIKSVSSVCSDQEFIQTFYSPDYDRVLSEEGEFPHDQQYHILSTIKLLLSAERERNLMPLRTSFEQEMVRIKELVRERHGDILYLNALSLDPDSKMEPEERELYRQSSDLLITLLSAFVDGIFTLFDNVWELRNTKTFDIFDLDLILDEDWLNYFYGENGRYKGKKNVDIETAWEQLHQIASKYRAAVKTDK